MNLESQTSLMNMVARNMAELWTSMQKLKPTKNSQKMLGLIKKKERSEQKEQVKLPTLQKPKPQQLQV
jgi:flagellar basal body rod protein FlgC